MVAFLHDDVLDDGLQALTDNGQDLHICTQQPTTYTEAVTTYTIADKNGITVGSPTNGDASGRKVVVSAITDGDVTGTDTGTHYAIVDVSNTKLLATEALSASQGLTSGNTFTLTAIDITIPHPA